MTRLSASFRVEVRTAFISYNMARMTGDDASQRVEDLAQGFARAKVHNPQRPNLNETPLPGEVGYERRRLENGSKVFGLLYDGLELMRLMEEIIDPAERRLGHVHVIFTNQLFGTWEDDDRRYHARASLYGFPSLISTTGLVEAPAKPREFYFLKQQYASLGMADAVDVGMKKEFRGRVLEHGDERLTEIAKGYALQAICHQLWGEPFCPDSNCRLFNAHWQAEVLASQIGGNYEFCPQHRQMLRDL
ncbi:MAG: hypothetical protein Q7R39_02155 [Dehalococcoidia bacterium]|nr:hypothetical protein [Dehalococcoidia bacterium]